MSAVSGLVRNPAAALPSLFSREGGSPDWIPAFAEKQVLRAECGFDRGAFA